MDGGIYWQGFAEGLTPDPTLTVSEWADTHRMLSNKASAEPGRWRTSRTPYLRGILDSLSVYDPCQRIVFMAGAQIGKALALDTPIPTPSGWTTMGDIRVGDSVFDADGKPTMVIGVSEIFTGHDCYAVRFSDGEEIIADADHLWVVDDCPGKNYGLKTLRTKDIAKNFKAGNRNRYAIDVTKPLECEPKILSINPYVLGVWLGDGNSMAAQVTSHVSDVEIAEYIRAAGHAVEVRKIDERSENVVNYIIDRKIHHKTCKRGHNKELVGRLKNGACKECGKQRTMKYAYGKSMDPVIREEQDTLHRRLLAYGLIGNKHIPADYLRASYEQRIMLIQGLMDTDGYIADNGRSEFCTASRRLMEDFVELARSLGIKPSVYKSKSCNAFRVSFVCYNDKQIFRLRRKAEKLPSRDGRRVSETDRRRIVDVRLVNSVPTRCILVDNERHLFLAGRGMIPTHNTEGGNCWLGYVIHHAPAPFLYVLPTVEIAQKASKQRIAPMIEESPVLAERIAPSRSRDSGNSLLMKQFQGGVLMMTGANSAAGLRSMPIRFLYMDEVDAWPGDVEGEGDPVALAEKRTTTFSRRKVFMTSTPTVKDSSKIEREFLKSDQRRYFVPCPHCAHMQWLRWRGFDGDQDESRAKVYRLVWIDDAKTRAGYLCEGCGGLIEERHKTWLLEHGEWQATAPGDGVTRGFHINSLYSPAGWKSWVEILREFEEAASDPAKLKVFVNTTLGETFEEAYAARLDAEGLGKRAEHYPLMTVPDGGLVVTAGVDVQPNRIEIVQRAWGVGEESWLVNYTVVHGDPYRDDLWDQVLDVLSMEFEHASGGRLVTAAAAIDSGDGNSTHQVYAFCRKHKKRNFLAIKGQSQPGKVALGKPTKQDINLRGQSIKRGVELYPVGSDTIKTLIYGRLKSEASGPGAYHWPVGLPAEYYKQLTAEKQRTKWINGFPKKVWWKPDHERNEALDVEVYAYSALQFVYTRHNRATMWEQFRRRLGLTAQVAAVVAAPEPAQVQATGARSGGLSLAGWRRGGQ